MKFAKILSIFTFLFVAVGFADAQAAATQNVAYSWSIPTTRADGSPLAVTELAKYTIYYTVDGGATQSVDITPATGMTKVVSLNLSARDNPYTLTSAISAWDTKGLQSALSPTVTTKINVLPASPSTPANFKLTVTCASGSCSVVVQ